MCWSIGSRRNIKMTSYTYIYIYMNLHHKDKLLSRPSYVYKEQGNPYMTGKTIFISKCCRCMATSLPQGAKAVALTASMQSSKIRRLPRRQATSFITHAVAKMTTACSPWRPFCLTASEHCILTHIAMHSIYKPVSDGHITFCNSTFINSFFASAPLPTHTVLINTLSWCSKALS